MRLKYTNLALIMQSIFANSASMCTSNATIECDSVSAGNLSMKTANGPINANISLLYARGEGGTLILQTSNG